MVPSLGSEGVDFNLLAKTWDKLNRSSHAFAICSPLKISFSKKPKVDSKQALEWILAFSHVTKNALTWHFSMPQPLPTSLQENDTHLNPLAKALEHFKTQGAMRLQDAYPDAGEGVKQAIAMVCFLLDEIASKRWDGNAKAIVDPHLTTRQLIKSLAKKGSITEIEVGKAFFLKIPKQFQTDLHRHAFVALNGKTIHMNKDSNPARAGDAYHALWRCLGETKVVRVCSLLSADTCADLTLLVKVAVAPKRAIYARGLGQRIEMEVTSTTITLTHKLRFDLLAKENIENPPLGYLLAKRVTRIALAELEQNNLEEQEIPLPSLRAVDVLSEVYASPEAADKKLLHF